MVTGASGLVGRHLTELLLRKNYAVDGIYFGEAPARRHEYLRWIRCNLQEDSLTGIDPATVHALVHAAALQPADSSPDETCYQANTRIDKRVFEFCSRNRDMPVVYLSSIYISQFPEAELEKHSRYLSGKRNSEKVLEQLGNPWGVFRISSPYGIYQRYRNVLKKFMENALAGKELLVFGSGERTQDFIAADDVAEALLLFLEKKMTSGIFNICSGKPVSMIELARLISSRAPHPVPVKLTGQPDPQDDYRAVFDNSGAREKLNWSPRMELDKGIAAWFTYLQP